MTRVSLRMVSDMHAPQDGSDCPESMKGSCVYAGRLVMRFKNSYQDSSVGLTGVEAVKAGGWGQTLDKC